MIAKRNGKNFYKTINCCQKKGKKKRDVRENPRIRMFLIIARYITLWRHIRKKIFFKHRTP